VKAYKLLTLIAAVLLVAIPVAAQSSAIVDKSASCSMTTLRGSYGGFAQGTILVQLPGMPAPPFPWAGVGLHNFDGSGNWSVTYAMGIGGAVVPWGAQMIGTYTISRDCTLAIQGTDMPTGSPVAITGTISGEGLLQEVHFMYAVPYTFASGMLRKTPRGGCSQRTFRGTYAVFGQGTDVDVAFPGFPPPPFPMGHVGKLTANGLGYFSGAAMEDMDGFPFPATSAASYTVKADCSVSGTIADSALGLTIYVPFQGVITGEGQFQEIHIILTNPGSVFADTWKTDCQMCATAVYKGE